MELRGKVSIITGAGSGIGAACARAFAAEGSRVVVADRNAEGAKSVAAEFHSRELIAAQVESTSEHDTSR